MTRIWAGVLTVFALISWTWTLSLASAGDVDAWLIWFNLGCSVLITWAAIAEWKGKL
jgi:uncharacterized RDD family membrane protein YckC